MCGVSVESGSGKITDALKLRDWSKALTIVVNENFGMFLGFAGGVGLASFTRIYVPWRHSRWPYTAVQAEWYERVLMAPLKPPYAPKRIVLPMVLIGWVADRTRRWFKKGP